MKSQLAFDVGHSSIGWAVFSSDMSNHTLPLLKGCGVVLFEKDSALAIKRRQARQQRRHVRATRMRIWRLERLLEHIGALNAEEIARRHGSGSGHPAPWQLAASVLVSRGEKILSWGELWEVLRWYAHNRGYEPWGEADEESVEGKEDVERVKNAQEALKQFGTESMAETVCHWLGVDPMGVAKLSHEPSKNLRQRKAAFPREVVRRELGRILRAHEGKLLGLDEKFTKTLMYDGHILECPAIRLPKRYQGGLLFGRLQMRYDNRIISCCVHTAAPRYAQLLAEGKSVEEARRLAEREAKVPNKKSPEFLYYRWGMLLANLRINTGEGLRPLSAVERGVLHGVMLEAGRLTKGELREALRLLPGWVGDDFENLFMLPDSENALLLDPVSDLIHRNPYLQAVWPLLPEKLRNRLRKRWWRVDATGQPHRTDIAEIREEFLKQGGVVSDFDKAMGQVKKAGKIKDPEHEPLHIAKYLAKLQGRAAYSRKLLKQAFEEVMSGGDPKASGGCLEETALIKDYREGRPFEQQTNNHLVRHRLLILERLMQDIMADPELCNGRADDIERVTIEVNRELRDHSGKTAKEIASDLGIRLKSHKDAVKWLEDAGIPVTGSMIRKARVALDMGCRCPYTGIEFEATDIREGQVDLDHIIPRSKRHSDSLDSLVLTFPAVNRWKGARTAAQFIAECGGKEIPPEFIVKQDSRRNLEIMQPRRYAEFVRKLDTRGHEDDKKRKRRRKEFLEMASYEERDGTFTPGQLTQTSQLARLARVAVKRRLKHLKDHDFVFLPGSVTGAVRKSWNLMGCLATVCPEVLDAEGKLRPKDDIRGISHLHHAVDAITLGYASALLPNQGDVWQLLSMRKIPAGKQAFFKNMLPVDVDVEGRWRIRSLLEHHPEVDRRIRECLAERRVVQHVPADMSGLSVEQNTRGVIRVEDGRVYLRQKAARGKDGLRPERKKTDEPLNKAFGLNGGKLAKIKGVRVVESNFCVVILDDQRLDPKERFVIVPHQNVWKTLAELRKGNGGKPLFMLRNGQNILLRGGMRPGVWTVRSIKNNAKVGILFDLSKPDQVAVSWKEVRLKSLLRDGLEKAQTTLVGRKG